MSDVLKEMLKIFDKNGISYTVSNSQDKVAVAEKDLPLLNKILNKLK